MVALNLAACAPTQSISGALDDSPPPASYRPAQVAPAPTAPILTKGTPENRRLKKKLDMLEYDVRLFKGETKQDNKP